MFDGLQALEHVGPAVDGAGHVLLGHAGDGLAVGGAQVDHAEQRRCAAKARAGQESTDLDVGVGTDLEPAKQLHDRALAEHDRRVALLAAEDLRRPLSQVGEVGERLELPAAGRPGQGGAAGERAAGGAAKLGALGGVDQAAERAVRVAAEGERDLILGLGAVAEADRDAGQRGGLAGHRRDLADRELGDRAALRAEPPPRRQIAREGLAIQRVNGRQQGGGGHGIGISWAFSVLSRRNHRNE